MVKYLTVTVDCDNDEIELAQIGDHGEYVSSVRQPATSPYKMVGILENLLHLMDASHVTLQTQSDGQIHHVEEW
jgi:hypothetical protein